MSKFNARARHQARRLAVQALYQWQYNPSEVGELLAEFHIEKPNKVDQPYFHELLTQVIQNISAIDAIITPVLDRPLAELTPVELAVLRVAVYELKNRLDVPYRVVINEALELTKTFGTQDGYRYVNGVLDRLRVELRLNENS
jgi:N utilization substance protein B